MTDKEIELAKFQKDFKKFPYNKLMMKYGSRKLRELLEKLTEEAEGTFEIYLRLKERDLVQEAEEHGNIATAEDIIDKHIGGDTEDNDEIDILEEYEG